jgi:hypothetical protein
MGVGAAPSARVGHASGWRGRCHFARDALARAARDALNGAVIGVASTLPHGRAMRSRLELSAARLYFPLARLALCADCEVCFEIGLDACPACGCQTWSPLARLIGHASEGVVVRAVRAVVAETTGNGAARGDAHHLVIVSRDQPKLYEMLRRELHDSATVTVIQDRRGSRPQPALARMNLRWRNVERQIAALGWAIVRADVSTPKR